MRVDAATAVGPASVPEASPPKRERDLLSAVCHDLKAPLASIVMGAGFLRRVLPPGEEAALRVVDAIHRSADRMDRLIASFHDLGRLQSHELTLDRRPHELHALARAAYEQLVNAAMDQGVPVSLEVESGRSDAMVYCDRERLLQSLRLLAACALRVLPEGGSLVMRAGADATGEVRFEVEGTPGEHGSRRIPAELPLPELAMGRGLVELHGGCVQVVHDEDRLSLSFRLSELRASARAAAVR